MSVLPREEDLSPSEIDLLQSPVKGPLPCGEDLEYDPDFMALQQATTGKRDQQFGSTIIPAEPPDWNRVERIAIQLCQRTRDVRVLVPLTLAWTESRGLPGYVEGLRLIDAMLQTFWNDVHPRIGIGDVEDPLPRMNALAALAEAEGLGRSVRNAPLLEDGGSSVSLRQVEALLDSSKTDQLDYPGGVGRLRDTARRAHEKSAPPLVALRQALTLLQHIRETSEHALGQSWAPDFSRVERSLRAATQLLPEQAFFHSGTATQPSEDGLHSISSGASARGTDAASSTRALSVNDIEISSRDDVHMLLEKACEYLERTEPSHPAPLLIHRAQRLMNLNFFQLIEELLPEGLQKMESLSGQRSEGGTAPG
jgi:type VI secretion system protein ImpA